MGKKVISNSFTVNTIDNVEAPQQIYSYSSSIPSSELQSDKPNGWEYYPLQLSQSHRTVYISTRRYVNNSWTDWSTPALFSYLAEDGKSIKISGTAVGIDSYPQNPQVGDVVLLMTSTGGNIEKYINPTGSPYWDEQWAEEDAAYMYDGDLYVSVSGGSVNWQNVGQIKGDKGDKGDMGKNYYFAETWSSSRQDILKVTDYETPYFVYGGRKWVFIGANGQYTCSQMGAPTINNPNFELMVTDFKYLITKALFTDYAELGSWIFNEHSMFSNKGLDNSGNEVSRGSLDYFGIDDEGNDFMPNASFDARTGEASLSRDKVRFKPDGGGWLANKHITWDEDGNASFNGVIRADMMYTKSYYIPNVLSSYTIDPTTNPANVFRCAPTRAVNIVLPDAGDYEGLELRFLCSYAKTYKITIQANTGDSIYFVDGHGGYGWQYTTDRIEVLYDCLVVIQNISSTWYVVGGAVIFPTT